MCSPSVDDTSVTELIECLYFWPPNLLAADLKFALVLIEGEVLKITATSMGEAFLPADDVTVSKMMIVTRALVPMNKKSHFFRVKG